MIVRGFKIEPGADLSRANLMDAYLWRADLSGADLSCADLSGADLSRANLSGADLRYANLRYADLRNAKLSGADLWCAHLYNTLLTADQLMWMTLTGQITPYQANQCTVLITQDKQMVDTDQTGCYTD